MPSLRLSFPFLPWMGLDLTAVGDTASSQDPKLNPCPCRSRTRDHRTHARGHLPRRRTPLPADTSRETCPGRTGERVQGSSPPRTSRTIQPQPIIRAATHCWLLEAPGDVTQKGELVLTVPQGGRPVGGDPDPGAPSLPTCCRGPSQSHLGGYLPKPCGPRSRAALVHRLRASPGGIRCPERAGTGRPQGSHLAYLVYQLPPVAGTTGGPQPPPRTG